LEFPFPKNIDNGWKRQAFQRDFILKNLKSIDKEDYIMFSDPDEIPNPNLLKNFFLKKKYGIFLQKHFVYKINLLNQYENPWEGTRVVRKKNLFSIDYMRKKVLIKNLRYSFLRIDKEKNI
jgi:beta-1,4-mannosyl-glycoprotein beta-1,4-N-acetylglucosaminyltransferase